MSDLKSKLPDLKEIGDITGKLFNDLKKSVTEIIKDYKKKHAEPASTKQDKPKAEKKEKEKE